MAAANHPRQGEKSMRQWRSTGLLVAIVAIGAANMPVMAALPAGSQDLASFQKADVGGPDTPGSVTADAKGVWTVNGSGNQYQDNSADQFYFIYKAVNG